MARLKTLSLGALNIKIQPYSPYLYVELIRSMANIKEPVQVRGADWGTIGFISRDDHSPIMGSFYRYLDIDPSKPWYNTVERRPLETEHGEVFPVVPEHFKPNFREASFLFYPNQHRLIFDLKDITHNGAFQIIKTLSCNDVIRDRFGEVHVVVESSRVSLEKILAIPTITKLEIFLTRPNPDDIQGAADEVQNRMIDMGLISFNQVLASHKDVGIKPDKPTKGAMRLALSNGRVNAIGFDGGNKVRQSSDMHPDVESDTYDPNKELHKTAMVRIGEKFLGFLRSKLQDSAN